LSDLHHDCHFRLTIPGIKDGAESFVPMKLVQGEGKESFLASGMPVTFWNRH
jgi:riboflavin synthase